MHTSHTFIAAADLKLIDIELINHNAVQLCFFWENLIDWSSFIFHASQKSSRNTTVQTLYYERNDKDANINNTKIPKYANRHHGI